jgi:hypothetical protein
MVLTSGMQGESKTVAKEAGNGDLSTGRLFFDR